MRTGNRNLWALGVLLGSILAYTGWTGFETRTFFMGKTGEISGKVIDVFPNDEVQSYSRKIKYIYAVGDNFYVDFKKLGTKDAKQEIGNDLKLTYSLKNPERHKVKTLASNYDNSFGKKYYATGNDGYMELHLINGVFKYKEFAQGGKMIHDFVGEYTIINDSIKFKNYVFGRDSTYKNRPEVFVVSPDNDRELVDLTTKRTFKRI